MDETGVSTMLRSRKVLAPKGAKQVGAITSAERGEMITVAVAVNAQGNAVPPMFIFPRKRFREHFIYGGPPGCIGEANGSGWMQEDTFFIFLQHFIKHSKPTKETPAILLLDNHSSHLSCKALNLCRDNGVIMISFPPHCSHKLQPLDLTVFGPFKKCCSSGISAWLKSNPGKTLTIFDLPQIIKHAFFNAVNPKNIISGFQASGIYPSNPNIFVDSDFAPAYVTDRPQLEISTNARTSTDDSGRTELHAIASTSTQPTDDVREINELKHSGTSTFSPEAIRPFPKAPPRSLTSNRGRKRRKTAILTDTPEKEALEAEERLRNERKRKIPDIALQSKGKGKQTVVRRVMTDSSNEEPLINKIVKQKISKKKNRRESISETSEEDDTICLVCDETYNKCNEREDWLQCTKCKMWAHAKCAKHDPYYVCLNCLSEYSDESD